MQNHPQTTQRRGGMWQVGRKGVSVGINYTETSVVRAFKFERGKTRSLPLAKENRHGENSYL